MFIGVSLSECQTKLQELITNCAMTATPATQIGARVGADTVNQANGFSQSQLNGLIQLEHLPPPHSAEGYNQAIHHFTQLMHMQCGPSATVREGIVSEDFTAENLTAADGFATPIATLPATTLSGSSAPDMSSMASASAWVHARHGRSGVVTATSPEVIRSRNRGTIGYVLNTSASATWQTRWWGCLQVAIRLCHARWCERFFPVSPDFGNGSDVVVHIGRLSLCTCPTSSAAMWCWTLSSMNLLVSQLLVSP
jgi:hypothetical protein